MSHKHIKRHISRLMALLLCVMLAMTAVPTAFAAEGSCGDNLTWRLEAGTLTFTGSGAMTDFSESTMVPWYPYREEILRIELPEGLTNIGALAFYECENLTAAVIPDSVTSIGDFAFAYCKKMQMLTIGNGVTRIGESAFSDCYSVISIELPEGLTRIGSKGFYRCETITTITVPESVTSMGVSVFAYCSSLVSATVNGSIKTLPEYTFYGCEHLAFVALPDETESISSFSFRGCDQLDVVYYGGSAKTLKEIENSILNEVPEFESYGTVTDQQPADEPVSSDHYQYNEDDTLTEEKITVTTGQNSSVSVKTEDTYQTNGDSDEVKSSVDITVNVSGNEGWEEVKTVIEAELKKAEEEKTSTNINLDIFVKNTDTIDSEFVEFLAGKPVNITVTSQNGSSWKIDASQIETKKPSGKYDLSYTLTAGSQELNEKLGAVESFVLHFDDSAQINSEVLILLGSKYANQNATLFQGTRKKRDLVQSVVVDNDGYAHFYLASVEKETQYYIGINVTLPEDAAEPIIPEAVQPQYGNVTNYEPIKYEITGRKSSWGMELGQVMGIMAAVMVSVIVIVGVVIYIWNKKRLKKGYVPGWDDADDE